MPSLKRPPAFGLLFALALLIGCSSSGPRSTPPEGWRLIPESTVLGEKRQFFLYGKGLAGAEVNVPSGTTVEKGWVKPDGKVMSLYLTVERISDDSTLFGDKPGVRRVVVKTPDTSVTVGLKILDEIPR